MTLCTHALSMSCGSKHCRVHILYKDVVTGCTGSSGVVQEAAHEYLDVVFIRPGEGLHGLQQVGIAQVQHCQLVLQAQQHSCHLLPACPHTQLNVMGNVG